MKRVNLKDCEIEVIECDCGYHLGVDRTFIEQVGHFETVCPCCENIIHTDVIDGIMPEAAQTQPLNHNNEVKK